MQIPLTARIALATALSRSARKDGKHREARKWAKVATRLRPTPRQSLDRWVIQTTAEIPTA